MTTRLTLDEAQARVQQARVGESDLSPPMNQPALLPSLACLPAWT
jgi:hypothetical protein